MVSSDPHDPPSGGGDEAGQKNEVGRLGQKGDDYEIDDPSGPPRQVREMMAMMASFGPAPNPLAEKITVEHISQMLDLEALKLDHSRTDKSEERSAEFKVATLGSIFVLVLVGLLVFSGNAPLVQNVLSGLIGLVGGALGGYGVGRSRTR